MDKFVSLVWSIKQLLVDVLDAGLSLSHQVVELGGALDTHHWAIELFKAWLSPQRAQLIVSERAFFVKLRHRNQITFPESFKIIFLLAIIFALIAPEKAINHPSF
jgi:hypothetical protein